MKPTYKFNFYFSPSCWLLGFSWETVSDWTWWTLNLFCFAVQLQRDSGKREKWDGHGVPDSVD